MIQNRAPGKDVSAEDMAEKFPLASKKNNTHFSKFDVSGVPFGDSLIPIMAGPNMVENEKLIVETAINVKKAGAHFLRGGAFKPLSFPYRSDKYTETREEGIRWLGIAKKETGIGVIINQYDFIVFYALCSYSAQTMVYPSFLIFCSYNY